MGNSSVSLLRCEEYNLELVSIKLKELIDLLGGIEKFVKKDSKVFVKLNCVGPFSPEMGITTHPVVVEAMINLIKTQTNDITIGDNPAIRDIIFTLKKNGIYPLIEKYDLKVLNPKEICIIKNLDFHKYSSFEVTKDMINCDTLINIAKMKTHTLTYMTGAQKNYFGLVYGLNKSGWHVKANNPYDFSEALNDLYGAFLSSFKDKSILNIIDGIIGLEGEGPSTGGNPKKAYCLIGSSDAISADVVACKIAKLDLNKLILANVGHDRNLGEKNNITIVGNKLDDFNDVSFSPANSASGNIGLKLIQKPFFRNILLEHPIINHTKCIKCGECTKICPVHTMVIKSKEYPHLKKSKCIRCWCCAEVCPQNAIIKSKRPIIGRIIF